MVTAPILASSAVEKTAFMDIILKNTAAVVKRMQKRLTQNADAL